MEREKELKDKTVLINKKKNKKDDKTILFNDPDKQLEKTAEIFETGSLFDSTVKDFPDISDSDSSQFPDILRYRRAAVSLSDDKLSIDRNFLKDASPLIFKDFLKEIKEENPPLMTGIENLDKLIKITPSYLTSISGNSGTGKTLLLLNIFLNMADIYKDFHFIFYSYGEKKINIEKLLINIAGSIKFDIKDPFISEIIKNSISTSNIDIWQQIFKNMDEDEIISSSNKREDMAGLKFFLNLSNRLHIVDKCYNMDNLLKSIELFNSSHLKIGAIFIDSVHNIPNRQLFNSNDFVYLIKSSSLRWNFPLILSYNPKIHGREQIFENSFNYLETESNDFLNMEENSSFHIKYFNKSSAREEKITLSIDPDLMNIT